MNYKKNKKNKWIYDGQALFEMVIVIGILVLILGGIVVALTRSVKNTTFSDESAIASRLAQEGIEWVRQERDNSPWEDFKAKANNQTRCLRDLNWNNNTNDDCGLIDNKFKRTITLSENNDRITVDVVVEWENSEGTHESHLTTVLTDWR